MSLEYRLVPRDLAVDSPAGFTLSFSLIQESTSPSSTFFVLTLPSTLFLSHDGVGIVQKKERERDRDRERESTTLRNATKSRATIEKKNREKVRGEIVHEKKRR